MRMQQDWEGLAPLTFSPLSCFVPGGVRAARWAWMRPRGCVSRVREETAPLHLPLPLLL